MSRRATGRTPVKPTQPKLAALPPNLPQHNLPEPYARLLTLGTNYGSEQYAKIVAELKREDLPTVVANLTTMALDDTYYDYLDSYPEWNEAVLKHEPRHMTRMHAVCVLTEFGPAAQTAVEPLLPLLDDDDDDVSEAIPFFYGAIGAPAIKPLTGILTDTEGDTFLRGGASECLALIGENHPESRAQIVTLLEQALALEVEDPTFAGFLVGNLLDLGAEESLPIIRQAFLEERVDETVVQMADVEEHFGLPVVTPRKQWDWEDEEDEDEEEEEEEVTFSGAEPTFLPATEEPPAEVPYVAPVKVGRNEPCPCGSGKKYKKCCGA